MTRCTRFSVSCTVPMHLPSETSFGGSSTGMKCQVFSLSRDGRDIPRTIEGPVRSLIRSRGALYPVVNGAYQPGSEFHREGHPRTVDILPRFYSRGLLVDLDNRPVPLDLDDLSDDTDFPDIDQLEHTRVGNARCLDNGTVNPVYLSYDTNIHGSENNSLCITARTSEAYRTRRVWTRLLKALFPLSSERTIPCPAVGKPGAEERTTFLPVRSYTRFPRFPQEGVVHVPGFGL